MKTLLLFAAAEALLAFNPSFGQGQTPPTIIQQPTNRAVIVGNTATFSVAVSGTGPFTYQWRQNGTNLFLITTVAGTGTSGYSGDGGPTSNALLNSPTGVAADAWGNLFIADLYNSRVRKVDPNGFITTVAGNSTSAFSGDGGPATNASLHLPTGVAVDAWSNLFIADSYNSRVRKVDPNGFITTVVGNGTFAFSGDGGLATNASLNAPWGVAVDTRGNLFIADNGNGRVRKVDTNGLITTFFGNGGEFSYPAGVAADAWGNLFVADAGATRIYKVDTNGFITTVAGRSSGFSGDGGPATNAILREPSGVAADAWGNLFIADSGNGRVRKVDTNGIINTVAGSGTIALGDGGPAINASLASPQSVAVNGSGTLLIADNNRIREVDSTITTPASSWVFPLYNANSNNDGSYQVIVSNDYGSVTSSVATLTTDPSPTWILNQPTNLTVSTGSNASFAVNASGITPINYQWFFDGVPLTNNDRISGAQSSALLISNAYFSDSGSYQVFVSDLYLGTIWSTISSAAMLFVPYPASSPGLVTNATEAALIAAMAGGGSVKFETDGTIWLTNTLNILADTILDASGHNVTISGSNSVQIFTVSPSVTLVLSNLVLAQGLAGGAGGAVYNAGTLQAISCVFSNNGAKGKGGGITYAYTVLPGSPGQGGAVYNAGTLLLSHSQFITSWASGGDGAACEYCGLVGATSSGGNGFGGAIYNTSNAVTIIKNCIFTNNSALGGWPGYWIYRTWTTSGADASGGAIYNASTLSVVDSVFVGNYCEGSLGGNSDNVASAVSGGEASGAGLFSLSGGVSVAGTTFSSNLSLGGAVVGGSAAPGGAGGQAFGGGACMAGGTLTIVNCTFVNNSCIAGAGGAGGGNGGTGTGGAICVSGGSGWVTNATLAGNIALGGEGDPAPGVGQGDNVAVTGGTITLLNSILSCAAGQTNIFGPIIDAGYNLNSDATASLTNSTSSNGVDPKLGALGNYGGPTPTIPLLPGSLAIDHADPLNFPPTDQRGFVRPYAPAPDIGAFEYWPAPPNSLTASRSTQQMIDLIFWGTNGQSFRLLASSDLTTWTVISTNTIAASNSLEFLLPMTNSSGAFYQVISP